MIRVSNIERFAVHDGPGIRTTVFLKGCPLHCPWCANPETWTIEPVLMHKENACVRCKTCVHVCPNHAVTVEGGSFTVNRKACDGCGICVRACLNDALSINGTEMEEEEIIKVVLRDRDYYEESGGGVTFSGGEPLFQKEGILRLLKRAKEAGLHTAVETTGAYDRALLEEAQKNIDLFLFDIKHVNAQKLQETTGADWEQVRGNFEYLTSLRGQDVIARVPVIPDFNEPDLEEILTFLRRHPVKAVHLLPFHNLGRTKWHQLKRTYRYEEQASMKQEALKPYADDKVSIGGQG